MQHNHGSSTPTSGDLLVRTQLQIYQESYYLSVVSFVTAIKLTGSRVEFDQRVEATVRTFGSTQSGMMGNDNCSSNISSIVTGRLSNVRSLVDV